VTGEGSLFDVPPAAIGRFRVLHQVGAGTCGPVFRAADPEADVPVAIKLFTINLLPERLPSFAEALADLVASSPPLASAVMPLAAGLHGHTPYLATSFAEGDSLDVALKQFGPAALPDLVPRVRALAGVLDAAASRGILHGALHPRDVTVSEAETTLTGLGIWPILSAHGERLPIRRPYRAPELGENAVSAAGDQFSLAALAYEWMTGRRAPSAFVAGDMAPVPGADRDALADVFARALHPDPTVRFTTCGEFVSALAEVAAVMADETEAASAETRPRRRAKATPPPALPLESPEEAPVATPGDADDGEPLSLGAFPPETDPVPLSDAWSDAPMAPERLSAAEPYAFLDDPPPVAPVERAAPLSVPRAPIAVVTPPISTAREPLTFRTDDRSGPTLGAAVQPTPSGFGISSLIAGIVLGVAIGIGVATFLWGGRDAPTSATAGDTSASAPATDALPPAGQVAEPSAATPASPPPDTAPRQPRESEAGPAATPSPAPASRAPSSSPAPAAAAAVGNLLVRTTPDGATVFIDGERRGVTPLTVQRLPLGTRRVRVQRDGFAPEERQVALTQSRPSRSLDLRLTRPATAAASGSPSASAEKTGTLIVESRPTGATVLLNGRPAGTTPVTIGTLAPGTYTVQLQLADFRPVTTTVRVVAGERARVAASLTSVLEP
jgi:serine/threonine protein kinase